MDRMRNDVMSKTTGFKENKIMRMEVTCQPDERREMTQKGWGNESQEGVDERLE